MSVLGSSQSQRMLWSQWMGVMYCTPLRPRIPFQRTNVPLINSIGYHLLFVLCVRINHHHQAAPSTPRMGQRHPQSLVTQRIHIPSSSSSSSSQSFAWWSWSFTVVQSWKNRLGGWVSLYCRLQSAPLSSFCAPVLKFTTSPQEWNIRIRNCILLELMESVCQCQGSSKVIIAD